MKKDSDNKAGMKPAKNCGRPVFMAYTINNTQPVVCTLVADQPYFYMEENDIGEDDILGLEAYADFEKDMADLKKKMHIFERLSEEHARDPARRLEEFAAEAVTICEREAVMPRAMNKPVDMLVATLSESRMAKALLDFAHEHGVSIVESKQVDGAAYDRSSSKIMIHPGLGESEQGLLAVRELRRHWQHRNGVMIHPLTFHPDQAVLVNRAQIADLTIAMVRVGWELQLAGSRTMWEHIENSSLADLGRAFAREAFVDFRSLANGKASSSVFENWFLSERSRYQDKKLIQLMLADHQGYVFRDVEASRNVSIELISALGEQPFGKNYLASHAKMIIEDPIFTEVRDRSNANFLWFIKFERSFRETEQALQNEGDTTGDDVLSAPAPSKTGLEKHGATPVIPLNRNSRYANGTEPQSAFSLADDSANVIHVQFGSGRSA